MAIDTINFPITLEQLLNVVRQLKPNERQQVAHVLAQTELENDLASLINELYLASPADDISDNELMAEIRAVRQQNHSN